MPLYDYHCRVCGKNFDAFRPMVKRVFCECPECNSLAIMFFNPKNSRVVPKIFEPYIDENITGDPVLIETQRQKDRMLKEQGLVESGNDMEWK